MSSAHLLDHAPAGADAAAAESWAVLDALYSDALFQVAAIAAAGEHTLAVRAATEQPRRPGGLTLARRLSRHAADETAGFPRRVA